MKTSSRIGLALVLLLPLAAADCGGLALDGGSGQSSAASSSGASPTPECASNKECIDRFAGEPYICGAARKCVPLTSTQCSRLLADAADIANDATVWFGVTSPLTRTNPLPGDEEMGLSVVNAVQLARDDFKHVAGGLPPASPGGPRRPLGFVVCDESHDDAQANTVMARHLSDDVHVPAIIGGFYDDTTMKIFTEVALPNKVLLLSARSTSSLITTVADDNLLWRTSASDTNLVAALKVGIEGSLEPALKAPAPAGVIAAGEPMRVMVVNQGDRFSQAMAKEVTGALVFNGKAAALQPSDFKVKDSGDPHKPPTPAAYNDSVMEILAFKPHLVVFIGSSRVASTAIMTPAEAAWPVSSFQPRWWFLGDEEGVALTVGANTELRKRVGVLSTGPNASNEAFAAFRIRYAATFPEAIGVRDQPNQYAAAAFDAAYALALGVVASGSNEVTGPNLARSFAKLASGASTSVVTGPENIEALFRALTSGNGVNLSGPSGSLDFDLASGDVPQDVQFKCVTTNHLSSQGSSTFACK